MPVRKKKGPANKPSAAKTRQAQRRAKKDVKSTGVRRNAAGQKTRVGGGPAKTRTTKVKVVKPSKAAPAKFSTSTSSRLAKPKYKTVKKKTTSYSAGGSKKGNKAKWKS